MAPKKPCQLSSKSTPWLLPNGMRDGASALIGAAPGVGILWAEFCFIQEEAMRPDVMILSMRQRGTKVLLGTDRVASAKQAIAVTSASSMAGSGQNGIEPQQELKLVADPELRNRHLRQTRSSSGPTASGKSSSLDPRKAGSPSSSRPWKTPR